MVFYFSKVEDKVGARLAKVIKALLIAAFLVLPFLAYAVCYGTKTHDDRYKTALVVVLTAIAIIQGYAAFVTWRDRVNENQPV